MFKLTRSFLPKYLYELSCTKNVIRKFLSPAYHCTEVWESRLNQPLFKKINLDELYHELDQHYQKTKNLSFIDVDIFVNAITDDSFDDEMLDLVHKLRLSSETSSSLPSMSYAVIRTLLKNNKIAELHTVLEDRLNYGVFLDTHTSNILLNHFWSKKDFISGARIASHSMLQEDSYHPVTNNLCLLHCYNCLLNKGKWSAPPQPEEPKEEVKIRVKYIRNEFDDLHFDLKDSNKIIGKTLMYLTKDKNDSINNSFFILGACLLENSESAASKLDNTKSANILLTKDIINLIPEGNEFCAKLEEMPLSSEDVNKILASHVNEGLQKSMEKDIALQCELFKKWEQKRLDCLHEKEKVLRNIERTKKVEVLRNELKEKETKLWFFENKEKIELEIEEKEELQAEEAINNAYKKIEKQQSSEEYVPPQIRNQ